jgi:uncharacterized protein YbaP (TraB family)
LLLWRKIGYKPSYGENSVKKAFCGRILALGVALTLFAATALAGEKSFLWKVQSKTATAFILGSVHLAKPDIYPLPGKIEESFDKSAVLALEADPAKAQDPALLQQMLAAAAYAKGGTLKEHLSGESFALARHEIEKLGLPLDSFSRTKPWFLAMSIETLEFQRLGYDPANGIDVYFAGKAAGKKPIAELESFDYQIRLLSGFSDREQELFLLYTIKDLATLEGDMEELMTAWRSGDTKTMEALATRTLTESPELRPIFNKLFYKRNREMTARIEQFLKEKKTVFVVVGAAHLIGKDGIIELLRGKGFMVEQM